jgi:hypothetical protein
MEALFPEELQTVWYDLSSSFSTFSRLYFEIKYRKEGRERDGFVQGIGKQYFITSPDFRETSAVRRSF